MAKKKKHKTYHKHNENKSRAQADAYRLAVFNSYGVAPESTVDTSNEALRGTNELHEYKPSEQKSVPTPLHIKLKYWIKDNFYTILLGTLLIGILSWLCISTIEMKVSSAEANVRIEYLQRDIDELKDSSVNKDEIEKELQAIREDLEAANIFDIKSIENRVNELEKRVNNE